MLTYPLAVDLSGRPAVVVGGGQVALRRTVALLAAGAVVTVIAPAVIGELTQQDVTLRRRRYRDGDLNGAWLAHAATSDPDVNAAVAAEAQRRRIWCVRADDAAASAAWTPAVTRHGEVTVAVTAGGDPVRAQRLRSAIALALADGTLPVRPQRHPAPPQPNGHTPPRGPALAERISTPASPEPPRTPAPPDLVRTSASRGAARTPAPPDLVRTSASRGAARTPGPPDPVRTSASRGAGREAAANDRGSFSVNNAENLPRSSAGLPPVLGRVALVGGGPGDPGLLTVRGRRLLAEADVVVADHLAPRDVLAELDPEVEIIDAGKSPGAHTLTQDQINQLLTSRALAGQRVVRLKGGDPFVFGRGGEEALACVQAGVPFEVVPGVSSAVAVPAVAGIPVTHRGITQDFAVISAHLDPSHPGATVDWAALATGPGTLVLLMAVGQLEQITRELVKRGRDAATPVAVICAGTTPRQRVLTSTLGEVAAEASAQDIAPPAVVVVGDVVRLRALLGSP